MSAALFARSAFETSNWEADAAQETLAFVEADAAAAEEDDEAEAEYEAEDESEAEAEDESEEEAEAEEEDMALLEVADEDEAERDAKEPERSRVEAEIVLEERFHDQSSTRKRKSSALSIGGTAALRRRSVRTAQTAAKMRYLFAV